jgi:acyl carrier protein
MDRLVTVFRDVFDMPALEINGLTRSTFSDWDSLAQVKLIIGIEEEFGVKFTIDQVANIGSVDEFRKLLAEKAVA